LLNITHNTFHIYLQHILFCPHLLLHTAGSVLQYTEQVYHTVSNSKQQFINILSYTYIHLINMINYWLQVSSDAT
jgi:L-cystine uptake protein TcyP (sodium:dicarboxylate symporter family)